MVTKKKMGTKIIEWLENWSDDDKYYFVMILDEDDNYIAKGQVEYKGKYKKDSYCSLYHLYVNEKYRGKGYFRQIIEHCLDNIKEMQYETVGLYAMKELMSIYEEYGFEFDGSMNSDMSEYSGYLYLKRFEYAEKK